MTPTEREYPYRTKWTTIIFPALLFGAGAVFLFVKAAENNQGLIINRVVELSPESASMFLWVLGGLSLTFVLAALVIAVLRLTLHQRIVLTDTGLTLPRSRWTSKHVAVPFSEILTLTASRAFNHRFLIIDYGKGKFVITASMLPKKDDIDEIHLFVDGRMRQHRKV